MEKIISLIFCIITIILLKFIFKINIKKAKALEENKKMQKVTDRFPENIEIAKEMLEMIDNKDVNIEEAKNTKTSLYIAVTNKILIADLKDNYARIQTIAHECMHSVQDRLLLMFNFIFSNISIIYFIVAIILTVMKIYTNSMLQVFILLLIGLVNFSVRTYLETDAMLKSRCLAEEYIKRKNVCSEEEKQELLTEYDKINNIGIPFTIDNLLTNILVRISIYIIVAMIV